MLANANPSRRCVRTCRSRQQGKPKPSSSDREFRAFPSPTTESSDLSAVMTKQQENPATVLIVNDDQQALDLFVDLLKPEGYKIFTAQSARRALEITSAVRTDIIICDVV